MATEQILKSGVAGNYWEYIMGQLPIFIGNPPESLFIVPWIPLENGQFISLGKLLHFQTLDQQISVLTRECNYLYASSADLLEDFKNHPSYADLINMIPKGQTELTNLGELMKQSGLVIGKINIAGIEHCLSILENLKTVPAWKYIQGAVEKYSFDDVMQHLLPIVCVDLQVNVYLNTLNEISGMRAGEKVFFIFELYLSAWVNMPGAVETANALNGLRLLSKADKFLPAAELVAGKLTNIAKNSVLCDNQAAILDRIITKNVNGPGLRNNANPGSGNLFVGGHLQKLDNYVAPFHNFEVRAAVGALIGLFGNGTKQLVTDWISPIRYEDYIQNLGWIIPIRDKNGVLPWMGDLSVDEALDRQSVHIDVVVGGFTQLNSITGLPINVPLEAGATIEQLVIGDVFYHPVYDSICSVKLYPSSVLDQRTLFDKVKIIRQTCEYLLGKIYNQPHADLQHLFHRFGTADQVPLDIARALIHDGLPQMLRTLPGIGNNPLLKTALGNLDKARRALASAEHMNLALSIEQSKGQLKMAREQLIALVKNNTSVKSTILAGIRERVTHNQYENSSIPFEIFQNADDAVVEGQHLAEAANPPSIQIDAVGRFVVRKDGERIRFAHWGRPINYAGSQLAQFPEYGNDLERMLMLGASAKDAGENVTGKFGLGFKSLLLASKSPRVWSGDILFEVIAGCLPERVTANNGFIAFRQNIPNANQQSLRGTFIELPLDANISSTDILDRFTSLAGILPVFARKLDCVEVDADTHTWHKQDNTLLDIKDNKIEIGKVFIPTAIGKVETTLMVFRGKSGAIAMRLGASGFKDFDRRAKFPLPVIWVTAPTRGTAARGVLMNGTFQIDTGRATLAQGQAAAASNTNVAMSMASDISPLLIELYEKSIQSWDGLVNTLGLDSSITAAEFWYGLWDKLIGEKPGEDASNDVHLLDTFGRNLFNAFLGEKGRIPNGLHGKLAAFLGVNGPKLSVKESFLQQVLPQLQQWPLFMKDNPLENWCSDKVSEWIKMVSSDKTMNIPALDLSKVVGCLNGHLEVEQIPYIQKVVELWPQNIGYSYNWKNELSSLKLKNRLGDWKPAYELIGYLSDEDQLLSEFAPDSVLLDLGYTQIDTNLKFFDQYFSPYQPSARIIAGWCMNAEVNKRVAVIDWLIRNLYGEVIGQLNIYAAGNNNWLFNLTQASSELQKLTPSERSLLLDKLSGGHPVADANNFNLTDEEDEPIVKIPLASGSNLNSIYNWWMAEGAEWLHKFDKNLWPNSDLRNALNKDPKDPYDRNAWMTLFSLGVFRKYGRATTQQHRGFILYLIEKKWWHTISQLNPIDDEKEWIGIIKQYVEEKQTDTVFEQWMDSFPRLYRVARWLDVYAHLFTSLDYRDMNQVNFLLTPASDSGLSGAGLDAPTLSNILRLGQHLVIRELLRGRVLKSEVAKSMAYAPNSSIKELINNLNCSKVETSQDIYKLLVKELDIEKANFNGAYDIPLQLIATDANARSSFNAWLILNS